MKRPGRTLLFAMTFISWSAIGFEVHAAPISFVPLGDLPGDGFESTATAISADGKVVVGYSESTEGDQAFRWTRQTGMVGLGDLPGGDFFSEANAVSADGSVVVGASISFANGAREAFRWTAEEGMVGLGSTEDEPFFREAFGVSGDGSIIVGTGRNRAIRWTAAEGTRVISVGSDPAFIEATADNAWDISANGSVILGTAEQGHPVNIPFLIDATGVARPLDPTLYLYAPIETNLSDDGTTVASTVYDLGDSSPQAFRWTDENGLELLEFPERLMESAALDISGDGQRIVGATYPDTFNASGQAAI